MNPRISILPLSIANGLFGRWMRCQVNSLSLKSDEPKVGQLHEDEERYWEYYHIIIFPEKT
jgi:hypothetical protein